VGGVMRLQVALSAASTIPGTPTWVPRMRPIGVAAPQSIRLREVCLERSDSHRWVVRSRAEVVYSTFFCSAALRSASTASTGSVILMRFSRESLRSSTQYRPLKRDCTYR